jgi:hypothetical protein
LLLRITCAASQRRYLVDTGTAFSVLPYKGTKQLSPDLPCLRAAGGQVIPCYGELHVNVQFCDKTFEWTFLLADVESPLLGADFLRNYRLLLDLHGGCLIDAVTLQRFGDASLPLPPGSSLYSVLEAAPPKLRQLLSQYPDVINSTGVLPPV